MRKVDAQSLSAMLAWWLQLVEVTKGMRFQVHAVLHITDQMREHCGNDVRYSLRSSV